MKKLIVSVMALVLLTMSAVLPVGAAAHMGDIAVPYWTNVNSVSQSITFENGIGFAEGSVRGKFGSTNAQAEVRLYIQTTDGWEFIGDAYDSQSGMSAAVSYEFTPVRNATYKAEFTFTVYKSGVSEVVSQEVIETYTGN